METRKFIKSMQFRLETFKHENLERKFRNKNFDKNKFNAGGNGSLNGGINGSNNCSGSGNNSNNINNLNIATNATTNYHGIINNSNANTNSNANANAKNIFYTKILSNTNIGIEFLKPSL